MTTPLRRTGSGRHPLGNRSSAALRAANRDLRRRLAEHEAASEQCARAAREIREQLAGIIESAPDAILTVNARFRVMLCNASAERMFGRASSEVLGQPVSLLLRRLNRRALLALGQPGSTPAARPAHPESVTGRRADGSEFTCEASVSRSLANGHPVFTLILRDVSRRMRVMEVMLRNENALLDFFNAAPMGLMWVRPDGQVERVNRAQLELLGRRPEEVIGHGLAGFFSDPPDAAHLLGRIAAAETIHNHRIRITRPDGSIRHALVDANGLWRDGQLAHSRWFVRDISQRVELEREVLSIAEREREDIGRELHDDLCQELLGIEIMNETAARRWQLTLPEVARDHREAGKAVRHAIAHARELARGLCPPAVMGHDGLMASLQELALRTQRVFHRRCVFHCPAPVKVAEPTTGIHLYRIAQEAVSNAIRHGHARHIRLSLTVRDGVLLLHVRDNGRGLPRTPHPGRGMGLRVMRYRAGVINGSLELRREPRGGTSVLCTVRQALESPRPSS